MSGPASFNTPLRLITLAMRDTGLLEETEEPNSDQLAEYSLRLNDVINFYQTKGLKLWLNVDIPVPLTATKQTYTLGTGGDVNMTKPLRVLDGYYQDNTVPTAPTTRPIFRMGWQEWISLSTKSQTGPISQYFVDKQQLLLNVSFWMAPDTNTATNGVAHVLLQQQVTNFTGVTDTMNFPIEWFLGLRWALADEICSGQPAEVQARCKGRTDTFMAALEDWDVEDASTFFTVDNAGSSGSRFS